MAGIRPYILIAAPLVGALLIGAVIERNRSAPAPPREATVDALPFAPVELDAPPPAPEPGIRRNSVTRGLDWLASRQREDGSWKGPLRHTGLALLAFLSCGQTHLQGSYRPGMRSAMRFLHNSQGEDGVFRPADASPTELDQIITTLAVVTGHAYTNSPLFRSLAEPALGALSRMESIEERSKPWVALILAYPPIDDVPPPVRSDLHFWYQPAARGFSPTDHAAGVLCLLAEKPDPAARQLIDQAWPRFLSGMGQCFEPHYLYFGSMAIQISRNAPGTRWSDQLWDWQNRHQQEDGSFLPDPQSPADLGRVGATALMVMARAVTETYNFHVIEDRPR